VLERGWSKSNLECSDKVYQVAKEFRRFSDSIVFTEHAAYDAVGVDHLSKRYIQLRHLFTGLGIEALWTIVRSSS